MRPVRAFILAVVAGAVAASAHLRAHHSILGFDGSRGLELRGVVRKVVWANPHTIMVVDGERGERWTIESEGAGVLTRLGWSRDAIASGDRVRSVGAPARDGGRRMRCDFVQIPSGSRLPCFPTTSL